MLTRPYTLECTVEQILRLVSDRDRVAPVSFIELYMYLYGQYTVVYTVNAYGVF